MPWKDGVANAEAVSEGVPRDSPEDLAAVADALNARPRKTLGWKTPAEALVEHLASAAT